MDTSPIFRCTSLEKQKSYYDTAAIVFVNPANFFKGSRMSRKKRGGQSPKPTNGKQHIEGRVWADGLPNKAKFNAARILLRKCGRHTRRRFFSYSGRSCRSEGVDGMTVDEALLRLKGNGNELLEKIRNCQYKVSPVRRVELPKDNGGERKLGTLIMIEPPCTEPCARL